jgi:hypothetical protein
MDTESFPGVECGRGVTLTPHPLSSAEVKTQSRAVILLSLRAFVAYKKGETYRLFIYLQLGLRLCSPDAPRP